MCVNPSVCPSVRHSALSTQQRGHTGGHGGGILAPQPRLLLALAQQWPWWEMWGKKLEKLMQTQLRGSCCAWKSSGIPRIFRRAAAALAAVISCNRLALDTTASAKGKGGGGTKMHHLSMPGSSPRRRRCPGGMAVPTHCPLQGKDRMLPPLICVQRVQRPQPWLAGMRTCWVTSAGDKLPFAQ